MAKSLLSLAVLIAALRMASWQSPSVAAPATESTTRPLHHSGALDGCGGTAIAYSRDGKCLITANKRYARVWDPASTKPVTIPLDHGGEITDVAISSDGRVVVTCGMTRDVSGAKVVHRGTGAKVWNGRTGGPLLTLDRHDPGHAVWGADVSPDGALVATCAAQDSHVRLWSVATGREVTRLEMPGEVGFVLFSPDGTRLVAVGDEAAWARLWDVKTGKPAGGKLRGFGGRPRGVPKPACFSGDGRVLALCDTSWFTVVDALAGKEIIDSSAHQLAMELEGNQYCSVNLSDDGKVLVTTASLSGSSAWRTLTAEPLTVKVEDFLTPVAVSPDGRYMLAEGRDVAGLWDLTTGNQVRAFVNDVGFDECCFSPDGKHCATTTMLHGGDSDLWEVTSPDRKQEPPSGN